MTHVDPAPGLVGTGATSLASASPEDVEVLQGEAYAPQPRLPRFTRVVVSPRTRGILVFVLLAMLVGSLTGLLWKLATHLPSYQVDAEGNATISERGLTQVFNADAWFCLFGAVIGTVIGVLVWRWFRRLGWTVVPLAIASASLSGLLCWWVGMLLGPHDFRSRIARANAGDQVPIDFQLHTWSAILVWPFFATIPVLLYSSLGRDDQLRTSARLRRPNQPAPADEVASEPAPSTPVPPPAG
ncbi:MULTISPECIES: hypothetical protein [unclassified Luteococcus]|uniref:hypothetical protein n=1 Tax=unclassified Luteococcus TaxID=2639923 RepID=UPI00313AC994